VNALADTVVEALMTEFESWLIALPALHVSRVALNSGTFDAREAFNHLLRKLNNVLGVDPPPPVARTTGRTESTN
jgi:hypothetical protein